jgi:putative ABC transport system permease protein
MDTIVADVRSGIRMLLKYPTLSFVAILTLGLGIGLSTTVFCVVNGGLFKGLPFPEPDRVVALATTNHPQNQPRQAVSVHDIDIWLARQTSFKKIGAFGFMPLNLSTDEGRPERFSGGQLTVGAFEALGVEPIVGRGFREGDDRPGAEPVLLLGYDLWQERYGGSPGIIGTSIRVNGVFRNVIGVMPEKFAFPILEKAWIPLRIDPLATPRGEGSVYQVIARLKDDVSIAEAKAQLSTIASQIEAEFPKTNRGIGADVLPYAEFVFGPEIYGLL